MYLSTSLFRYPFKHIKDTLVSCSFYRNEIKLPTMDGASFLRANTWFLDTDLSLSWPDNELSLAYLPKAQFVYICFLHVPPAQTDPSCPCFGNTNQLSASPTFPARIGQIPLCSVSSRGRLTASEPGQRAQQ